MLLPPVGLYGLLSCWPTLVNWKCLIYVDYWVINHNKMHQGHCKHTNIPKLCLALCVSRQLNSEGAYLRHSTGQDGFSAPAVTETSALCRDLQWRSVLERAARSFFHMCIFRGSCVMHWFHDTSANFSHQEISLGQNFLPFYSCVSLSCRHDEGSGTSCNCTGGTVQLCLCSREVPA